MSKKKICIVGSGNWGSAIARIVGVNAKNEAMFDDTVNMYVYEEMINGEKLSEIINSKHENVKYLPGAILPENVVAVTDVVEAAKDADILIFVLPHQFIRGICGALKGKIKSSAIAVSLIKGLDVSSGGMKLISDVISEILSIDCGVLMGANLAPEVAKENYCEATIGSKHAENGALLKSALQASYFRLVVVDDSRTVELCGALKNVVAVGAGIVDGLGYGDNTKAAVIRLGLMEMIKFIEVQYPECVRDTFLESCGIADLITTCYGGRNRRVAEAMAKTGKSIHTLEQEMLNGQSLQGPPTAAEINVILKQTDEENRFPMFTAIHRICAGELQCQDFIDCLKNHPEHMYGAPLLPQPNSATPLLGNVQKRHFATWLPGNKPMSSVAKESISQLRGNEAFSGLFNERSLFIEHVPRQCALPSNPSMRVSIPESLPPALPLLWRPRVSTLLWNASLLSRRFLRR